MSTAVPEPFRILTVVGARPQFIKAAAVSRAIANDGRFEEILVHTGQHHDVELSAAQFRSVGLREADLNLAINGGSAGSMLGRMIASLDDLIEQQSPRVVMVYGDTTSTAAGAIAAAACDVPVAHVEAGLRSFVPSMPEERNRVLTDHLSQLLFVPTRQAVVNLAAEGLTKGVHHVGDVMLDVFRQTSVDAVEADRLLHGLGLRAGAYTLATLHRAESTSSADELSSRITALREESSVRPVVLPLHPRTRAAASRFGIDLTGLQVIEPVDYRAFSVLLSRCALVMTDSGGVQKEAYFHRVPCLTLRSETEWPETVDAGWNRLWTEERWREPRQELSEYGDGAAAERIVQLLADFCGSAPTLDSDVRTLDH